MFKCKNQTKIIQICVLILLGILLINVNNHSVMATNFNTKDKEIINHEINDQEELNKNLRLLNNIKQNIFNILIQMSSMALLTTNNNDFIEQQIEEFFEHSKQKYPHLIEKNIRTVAKWVFLNGDTEDQNKIYNILIKILFITLDNS
ncbi:MAG: SVM family protein [Candidatus Phytoplasma australasiaticum]|nr:SVM family protein [Candidatus Phytoplasma australasiaticum]MDV3199803.1 SVM family protein [Candidatus Phytoplasma australasiaticum]